MSYSSVVLHDAPDLYWPFGASGVADLSGNGRTATLDGSPSMVAGGLVSEGGNSMLTANNGVQTTYDAGLDVGTGDFTIEAWVSHSLSGDNYVTLFDRDNGETGAGVIVYLAGSATSGVPANIIRVWCGGAALNGTINVNDGVPHYIAIQRSSGTLSIFVDGTLDTSATRAGNTDTASYIDVGFVSGNPGQFGNPVTVQHMAYYKKSLGAVRISSHYAEGAGGSYAVEVLKDVPSGYWMLNEASGTVMYDSSASASNGTYTNSPTFGSTGLLVKDTSTSITTVGGAPSGHTSTSFGAVIASGTWTIEAWLSCTGLDGAASGSLFGCSVPSTANGSLLQVSASSCSLFYETTGGSDISGSASIVGDGKVHHLVATRSASFVGLYLDGVLIASTASPGTPGAVSGQVAYINTYQGGSTGVFLGRLGHMAFYSTALSARRIKAHYARGTQFPVGTGGGNYVATVLADIPVEFWLLNESAGTTATDSSGNARNGTYNGGYTLGVAGPPLGPLTKAVTFNGSTSYVVVPTSTALNLTNPVSLEAWIKTSASGATQTILGRANSSSGWQWSVESSGFVSWQPSTGVGTTDGAYAVNDGKWHHVVTTADGTNYRNYVDGVLRDTITNSTAIANDSTSGLSIGALWNTQPAVRMVFTGSIAAPAIYNGVALSAAQVANHFKAGVLANGLVSFYGGVGM